MLGLLVLLSLASLASCAVTRVRLDFIQLVNNKTGSTTIEVMDAWAPLGAARFLELVDQKFWSDVGVFRCVKNFVIQTGISGNPGIAAKWENRTIPDDPVVASNVARTLAFATAGPDTRTTQIFVNLGNNSRLDHMGFAPFARIVDGWDTISAVNFQYAELPDQDSITAYGNAYLMKNFPLLTYILRAVRV